MKLVMMAAIAAIALTAFTTGEASTLTEETFKYYDDLGRPQDVPLSIQVPSLCPPSFIKQCIINIDGTDRLIFHSDGITPYMRD